MNYSQDAIDLIKQSEGFSACVYRCLAGRYTIGYGHVVSSKNVSRNITEIEATSLLNRDLVIFSHYINQRVRVTLTQGQYDALCSLVYNWGCLNFGRSKGLRFLNQGQYSLAAIEFFSKEKGVVRVRSKFIPGLYKRRTAELKLWSRR